eukprot:4125605-Heterocapsa_arctica.AAC.1
MVQQYAEQVPILDENEYEEQEREDRRHDEDEASYCGVVLAIRPADEQEMETAGEAQERRRG